MIIPVVIISSNIKQRFEILYKSLNSDSRFSVILMEGKYLDDNSPLIDEIFDERKSLVLLNRRLSNGEIGCAYSHVLAQEEIFKSFKFGVILEDDARILNIDDFYNVLFDFFVHSSSDSLLNLVSKPRLISNGKRFSFEEFKIFGINLNSPLAVGYAIHKNGARDLSLANFPIYSVADWPYAKLKHFYVRDTVVIHGDYLTQSTINSDLWSQRNTRLSFIYKISVLSGFKYLLNQSRFLNYKIFYNLVLRDRVNHQIVKILLFLRFHKLLSYFDS